MALNSVDELEAEVDAEEAAERAAKPMRIGNFEVSDRGVFWVNPDPPEHGPTKTWICDRLDIVARTRGQDGEDWGSLLSWRDKDGRNHEWPMPWEMLAGDGSDIRRTLFRGGLGQAMQKSPRLRLLEYLYLTPDRAAWCVSRIGWHGAGYVLPDESFGGDGDRVIYQTTDKPDHAFRVAGTLEDWQQSIGRWCVGNSRLAFSVSAAFAAPLLRLVGEDSGGFHFRGGSSTGKTTALEVASSVWGGGDRPGFLQRWRATDNGLEAVAELHNDALLCLDELAQIDPKIAGEAAYALANGSGKARANRSGGARKKATWRLLFLSAGEISLRDHMQSVGKRSKAGQEIRMADIPMDAGKGYGGWEHIYEADSPDTFSRILKEAARRSYGTPIRAFLAELINQSHEEMAKVIKCHRDCFISQYVPPGASGEVYRVASRFALVAAAGMMAIEAGILPWPPDEPDRAAATCFRAWLEGRGSSGAGDIEAAIAQIRGFIEAHGSSRFEPLREEDNGREDNVAPRIINRVGFRRTVRGETEYLILGEAFRTEICSGFDHHLVARELLAKGYLVPGPNATTTDPIRLPGLGRARVYRIRASILEDQRC